MIVVKLGKERFLKKVKRREAEVRAQKERDRVREAGRVKPEGASAERILAKQIELRHAAYEPLTVELEGRAWTEHMSKKIGGFLRAEGAVHRGALRAMAKQKVQAERALMTEEEKAKFTPPKP